MREKSITPRFHKRVENETLEIVKRQKVLVFNKLPQEGRILGRAHVARIERKKWDENSFLRYQGARGRFANNISQVAFLMNDPDAFRQVCERFRTMGVTLHVGTFSRDLDAVDDRASSKSPDKVGDALPEVCFYHN